MRKIMHTESNQPTGPCIKRISTGQTIAIKHNEFVIGRARETNFCVSDNKVVSARHAMILFYGGKAFVKDLNSSNGSYLNGKAIPPETEIEIKDGDTFRLASEEFMFFENLSESAASEPHCDLAPFIMYAYNNIDPRLQQLFPSEYAQVASLIDLIATTLFGTVSGNEVEAVETAITFYTQYFIRRLGSFDKSHLYDDIVSERMVNRFSDLPKENVINGLDICRMSVYALLPEVQRRDAMIQNSQLVDDFVLKHAISNAEIENIYLEDEEYGLVSTKPVFIAGFDAQKEYVSNLITQNGEAVACDRLGSIVVDGISGPVDMYRTTLKNKGEYKTIYLSNYGTKTSKKAPAGFRLKQQSERRK